MDYVKCTILGRYSLKKVSLKVLIIVPASASLTYQGKNRQENNFSKNKMKKRAILYLQLEFLCQQNLQTSIHFPGFAEHDKCKGNFGFDSGFWKLYERRE